MRKSLRILMLIFTLIGMMFMFNQNVYATGTANTTATATVTSTSDALSIFESDTDNKVTQTTQTIMGTAISVIRIVGTGIAIIMLTYVAIKYMSAAPNEKAEFKKSATAYIVGAIILFAATNLLKIISDFATSNIG